MFLIDMFNRKTTMPSQDELLPGRDQAILDQAILGQAILGQACHAITGAPLKGPNPPGYDVAYFAMGKFWGAEKLFWGLSGVHVTAVGYAGGSTPNPTYQEVVTGLTGHTQTVKIVFDPARIRYQDLLAVFFEGHDPTQGMRQGSDIGTFFRSAIMVVGEAQLQSAAAATEAFQLALGETGHSAKITTEVQPAQQFYYAEAHHQQYLAKNPGAQSGLRPIGIGFARHRGDSL